MMAEPGGEVHGRRTLSFPASGLWTAGCAQHHPFRPASKRSRRCDAPEKKKDALGACPLRCQASPGAAPPAGPSRAPKEDRQMPGFFAPSLRYRLAL